MTFLLIMNVYTKFAEEMKYKSDSLEHYLTPSFLGMNNASKPFPITKNEEA